MPDFGRAEKTPGSQSGLPLHYKEGSLTMNKLEVLQNAKQLVAQIRLEKDSLKESARELSEYAEKDGAIPEILSEKLINGLKGITSLQQQFISNYTEVMDSDEIPDELTVMEENLATKKEELTKGVYVRAAAEFMGLTASDPDVANLLDSYKAEVCLDEARAMTPEEVADNYQKYVDFMEALAEDDASLRISYIYRLDEFFPAELLASVIILRNIKAGDEAEAEELAARAFAGELGPDYFVYEEGTDGQEE